MEASIASGHGQFLYIAQIPFETRAVSRKTFTPAANTLPLTDATTQFARSVTVHGTRATVAAPALGTFNFGNADRGRVERVDLLVDLPSDPDADADGDGVPDWAEQVAGTDPRDSNSVFNASTNLQPAPAGGIAIHWSSAAK